MSQQCVKILKDSPAGKNIYGNNAYITLTNDPNTSSARTQCSSFFTNLLKITYSSITDSYMKTKFGSTSPTAELYHNSIKSGNGFTEIKTIEGIQPGDVVAIRYDPPDPSANTGHFMIIQSLKKSTTEKTPFVTDTEQWEIEVTDSSLSYHGPEDTRYNNNNGGGGIGTGTARLYVFVKDRTFAGYTWSTYSNSEFYSITTSTRPIAIGRPTFLNESDGIPKTDTSSDISTTTINTSSSSNSSTYLILYMKIASFFILVLLF